VPGTHKKFTHSRPAPGCTAGLRGSAGAANLPAAPGRDSLPNRPAQAGAPASSLVGARGARPRRGAAVHRGGSPTPNCTPARSASGFLRHSSGLGRLRPARLTQSSWWPDARRRPVQRVAAWRCGGLVRAFCVRRPGAGWRGKVRVDGTEEHGLRAAGGLRLGGACPRTDGHDQAYGSAQRGQCDGRRESRELNCRRGIAKPVDGTCRGRAQALFLGTTGQER
jgi:hypothetical protein